MSLLLLGAGPAGAGVGGGGGGGTAGTKWDATFNTTTLSYTNTDRTVEHTGGGITTRAIRTVASKSSGKFYWEVDPILAFSTSANALIGIASSGLGAFTDLGDDANVSIGWRGNGNVRLNSSTVATIATYAVTDIACGAWDAAADLIWFRTNNGNWNNDAGADPAAGTGGIDVSALASTLFAAASMNTGTDKLTGNFGSADWVYAAPGGFGVFIP